MNICATKILPLFSDVPFPPESVFFPFLWGLAGLLIVTALVLTVVVKWKQAFGRVPPLDAILKELVTQRELKDYQKEQRLRHRGLEEQISKVRHDTSDAWMGVMRRGEERDKEIRIMADIVSRLQERTDTHIRSLDNLDGKIGRMMERMKEIVKVPSQP